MEVEVKQYPKRDAVLFVRLQMANKEWLSSEAKRTGYPDTATYVDSFITASREKSKRKKNKK